MNYNFGDILMKCKPFVHTLSEKHKSIYCDFCFKLNKSLLKCSKCHSMYYCNKKCQKDDWIECHRNECQIYSTCGLDTHLDRDCDHFLLRLWLKTQSKKQSLGTDSQQHVLYNGVKRGFNDLITHCQQIREDTKRLTFFNEMINRFNSWHLDIDYEILFQLFCKLCINSFSILNEDLNPIGTGLYICPSVLNHSCEPNAATVWSGIELEVRAIKPIESTQEVLINYLDLKSSGTDRRNSLRNQYYFDCNCNKCFTHSDINIDYNLVNALNQEFDELIDSQKDWIKCYEIGLKSISLYEQIYGDFHPDLTVQMVRVLKVKALITNDLRDKSTLDLIMKTQNAIKITHGLQHNLFFIFKDLFGF